jgi:hypothetical protein
VPGFFIIIICGIGHILFKINIVVVVFPDTLRGNIYRRSRCVFLVAFCVDGCPTIVHVIFPPTLNFCGDLIHGDEARGVRNIPLASQFRNVAHPLC